MEIGTGPLIDKRQSQTAIAVQRGVCRALAQFGFSSLTELALASGRRADVLALGPAGELWVVEIKSSLADFRADGKWPGYRAWCDRFLFAVPREFPCEGLPGDTGLMIADRDGGELIREGPEHRLGAARRKAVLLRFAHAGAGRLQGATDEALALAAARRE